jgi:Skp family chaperone for outer membrane proteins
VGYKFPGVKITAEYALRVLFLVILFPEEIHYWETEKIYKTLQQKAFQANYQGKWELVQEILEQEQPNLQEIYEKWQTRGGTFRSFQNLFGEVHLKRDIYVSVVNDNRRVKYPQRKRGYDDKGSRRLPHEDHGIPGAPETAHKDRIDRRDKVRHPLLPGWEEKPGQKELEELLRSTTENFNIERIIQYANDVHQRRTQQQDYSALGRAGKD